MDYGLGGYKTIDSFVEAKLEDFKRGEKSFGVMFRLMFRESENIMYEESRGYSIKRTTYGEAQGEISSMARALGEKLSGVEPGSVVGLYMENSLDWIECFWAILAAGYRPLLLNLRLPNNMLDDAISSVGCRAVISESKEFGVLTVAPGELDKGSPSPLPETGFGEEILVMSSGTSLRVKICAYSAKEFYYQICDSFDIIKKCALVKRHYEGRLKLLTFLPFYHVFGLIAVYIWFAFFSRTFVHLSDMAPQTIVNTIKRHRVTHIFAVPLFWEKVYDQAMKTIKNRGEKTYEKFNRAMALADRLPEPLAAKFSSVAFREVRENLFGESICFMISGGSMIPSRILRFFNGIGYRLANGYGMTEVGITSVELSSKRKYLNGAYVGGPMSHVEYMINGDGELLVKGDVIAKYVIENGERKDRSGWFNTHDLAENRDGHYRILGRRDDLIVPSGGENINPNLVEPRLAAEGVAGVCLIGVPKGEDETEPVLLVSVNRFIGKEKLSAIEAETKRLISDAGLSGDVGKICFVGGPLMKDEEFKLNRIRLAEDYASGSLPVVSPDKICDDGDSDELTDRIKTFFALALEKDESEIAQDADFFLDGGGTSLDYFAMISKLQDEFGIPFPTDGEHSLKTVRSISDYIRKAQNG